MKTVAYDGVAAVTSDAVADALLALAVTVARFHSYELVTIPVLGAAGSEQLTLMLGPTIHLSAKTDVLLARAELHDEESAVQGLRARSRAFTDPLHGRGRDLEAVAAG